ncbi:MAG: dienelactone hydrolase family protein [Ilumatobacteraceae bacterium]
MKSSDIEYQIDGVRYVGHMAEPDGTDLRPAVLVCHEAPGLTDHAKGRARRIADELGYVAFALDYWGDGKPLPADTLWPTFEKLRADKALTRQRATAGLDVLLAHPRADRSRVASIGYCFGGTMSLELGRAGVPLQGIVGFHSGLQNSDPSDAANITAKVLVLIGADDPSIPPEQRRAFEESMTAGGVDWQMVLYSQAEHSFTNKDANRDGFRYHARTDQRSWRAMVDFLAEAFDG